MTSPEMTNGPVKGAAAVKIFGFAGNSKRESSTINLACRPVPLSGSPSATVPGGEVVPYA